VDEWITLLLRLTHILAGVFWAGTAILIAGFIEPVARASGPEGGRFMQRLVQVRRLPVYLEITTLLTVLSGIALYWRASGGLQWAWVTTGPGLAFLLGGLAAFVAALLGQFVNAPTAARMALVAGSINADGPSPSLLTEMGTLQARLRLATRVGATLLALATAGMAIARYL
jgi:uncharacterized membrane protein